MTYERILLLVELGRDARAAVAAIRRLAPDVERLLLAVRVPGEEMAWMSAEAPADENDAASSSLDALRSTTAGLAASVETVLAPELDADALTALAADAGIDLVAAALPAVRIPLLSEMRKRLALPLLWTAGPSAGAGPIRDVACVAFGMRGRSAVGAFLRDHGQDVFRCTIVGPALSGTALAAAREIAGIPGRIEVATSGVLRSQVPDLIVVPRFPGALLAVSSWPAPVLVLPPLPPPRPLRRTIEAADAVDLGGPLRVRVTYAAGMGRLEPIPDQDVAFVASGRTVATVRTEHGFAEVPSEAAERLGLFRAAETGGVEPLGAIEQRITIIRPGARPLLLFDSGLSDGDLTVLSRVSGAGGADVLAVRLRPIRSCASLRARLAAFGLPPLVADASAVLDEASALDVGEELDAVRLSRVAARMRGTIGFPVAAVVHRGPHTPGTTGFRALRAEEVLAAIPLRFDPAARTDTLATRLDLITGAALIAGNRIELELDNPKARAWLLEAIAAAQRRIHFQVYMAADDDVGTRVERALADAGARGVAVRVLVDSLHGFQGSFGFTNPLLTRLGSRPNVELRVLRPIAGAPTLEDLKQRDHRKMVIVDGALALVGGRNLSHEYYAGFDEVALRPDSLWREVPWLDAGARVEGPAVEAVERSFLGAWTAAGGAPFEIAPQPAAGGATARVVVHHGLRDAATLETYLALIDGARSRVTVVNGFPLLIEIQRALLNAVARGVRVRAVVGHTTPTHAETPFGGPWSTARQAASALVDSRLDPLVAAGGEVYRLAVRERPCWAAGLGTVHPHVHAKVVSVDGRVATVGSANLDVTAGYWESELVLVVEDEAVTGALDARLDELIGGSERIDRDDPAWRESARRRTWMRHWPGVLSV